MIRILPTKCHVGLKVLAMRDQRTIALVVDDSEVVRDIVTKNLERLGCLVFTARNGEEAVKLAAKGFADLVMMDLYMPLMDGWTAAKEIRNLEKEAGKKPCFIVAMSSSVDVQSCTDAGINMAINKPVQYEQLVEILEHLQDEAARAGEVSAADR
jgi:CheY-like chemotaxis protein